MQLPTDRVAVAVFHPDTGKIAQIVHCSRADADKQHLSWPGHHFVDITGQHQQPHPNKHAIHLGTKRLMVKPVDLDEVRTEKKRRVTSLCRSEIHNAMTNPAVDDWMEFRRHRLGLLAGLLAKLDSASDVAGVNAINWG